MESVNVKFVRIEGLAQMETDTIQFLIIDAAKKIEGCTLASGIRDHMTITSDYGVRKLTLISACVDELLRRVKG